MELSAGNADIFGKILFLFLGWLLGMLSPLIVDAIRRQREVKEVKKALLAELSDLQFRLASAAYVISQKTGQWNRKFLEWFKPIAERNRDLHRLDEVLKGTEAALKMNDEELAGVAARFSSTEGKGMELKMHNASLLDTKIGQLGSFSVEFQRLLLEIHSRLAMLNEEVDQYRFYFQQTFSSNVSESNHDVLKKNIEGTYNSVLEQSRMICDFIDRAIQIGN